MPFQIPFEWLRLTLPAAYDGMLVLNVFAVAMLIAYSAVLVTTGIDLHHGYMVRDRHAVIFGLEVGAIAVTLWVFGLYLTPIMILGFMGWILITGLRRK